jgi:GNAT superfamily N-acetyltransferase
MMDAALNVRAFEDRDRRAVLELLREALGWGDDARFEELFAWKHLRNSFGVSAALVATDGDRIVGFRAFMRWAFERDGRLVRAVRAVDTATHPEYQGRGIFTSLTTAAIEAVRAEGVDLVFNTPNDRSRPGYLKMGWHVVGRIPVAARPLSATGLVRMIRARTPAERWSTASGVGLPASDVLRDRETVAALLARTPGSVGLRTQRDPEYLWWRYADAPFEYRAFPAERGVDDGVVVVSLRRRGPATEATLCEILVPDDDARLRRALVRHALRQLGADYAIRAAGAERRDGFVGLPRQGPVLTGRALGPMPVPALSAWRLELGDVERL